MLVTAERRDLQALLLQSVLAHLHTAQESSCARNWHYTMDTTKEQLVTYKQVETGFIAVGSKALSFQVYFPNETLISSMLF